MKHDEKHLPDWADDWVPRKKCPVCKARLVVCNTWGTAVEVCSESGWALEPDLDCHPLSAPPVAPVPPTAESEKLIENAMPEFVVPITRQIHANADDPTDSRKSELREDGPMSQMKWNDGCDALVDFVEEHGGSMGGETRDHLFNIVQNIIDGQVVGCNLDGDGYCSTHTSWRCFPNLGEPVPAPHLEHVLELRDDGWSLEHPQVCRESKSLLDCPVHSVVKSHEDEMELWEHGRFNVGLDEYGELEKLSSAPPVGTQE